MEIDKKDKKDYILKWLNEGPSRPALPSGYVIDSDKRIEILLNALQDDKEANILKFKSRP